jgi:hypothetical protein
MYSNIVTFCECSNKFQQNSVLTLFATIIITLLFIEQEDQFLVCMYRVHHMFEDDLQLTFLLNGLRYQMYVKYPYM